MPKSVLSVIGMLWCVALASAQSSANKSNVTSQPHSRGSDSAQAEIRDASGQVVGRATLSETTDGVRIQTTFSGLPAGTHGFHFHETGKCDPPFMTAGGHVNPEAKQHGRENTMGRHAGDLPNLTVPSNGRVIVDIIEPMVSLRSGPKSLMDSDGSALVVHERRDDDKTDPDGNSGARIACGVITN